MQFRCQAKSPAWLLLAFIIACVLFKRKQLPSSLTDSISRISTGDLSSFSLSFHKHLELDSPDNLGPLTALCDSVEWAPERIWQCDHVFGGVSNVYNFVAHCIRLAIEAGATTLIPPKVWLRSTVDPVVLKSGDERDLTDMSYFFDYTHFKTSLSIACPQMKIRESVRSLPGMPKDPRYAEVRPKDLGPQTSFRANLESHLVNVFTEPAGAQIKIPSYDYIIQTAQYFYWCPWAETEPLGLGETFKSILHFREDIRSLAGAVLDRLAEGFSLERIQPDGLMLFFGAHLRTGSDLGPEWTGTGRDEQYADYMPAALNSSLQTMYLASGAPKDVQYFIERAAAEFPSISITTKERLLSDSPRLLRRLQALAPDQQAIVDFEVLLRSRRLAGMHRSSFDWQLAVRRHERSEIPLKDCLRHDVHMFEDELGHVLNPEPGAWFDFFFYTTWP